MALTRHERAEIIELIRDVLAEVSDNPKRKSSDSSQSGRSQKFARVEPEDIRSEDAVSDSDPLAPVWELLHFLDNVIKTSRGKDQITFSKEKLLSKMPKRTIRRQMKNVSTFSLPNEREGDYDYRRCNNDWDPDNNDDDSYDTGFADCKAD